MNGNERRVRAFVRQLPSPPQMLFFAREGARDRIRCAQQFGSASPRDFELAMDRRSRLHLTFDVVELALYLRAERQQGYKLSGGDPLKMSAWIASFSPGDGTGDECWVALEYPASYEVRNKNQKLYFLWKQSNEMIVILGPNSGQRVRNLLSTLDDNMPKELLQQRVLSAVDDRAYWKSGSAP